MQNDHDHLCLHGLQRQFQHLVVQARLNMCLTAGYQTNSAWCLACSAAVRTICLYFPQLVKTQKGFLFFRTLQRASDQSPAELNLTDPDASQLLSMQFEIGKIPINDSCAQFYLVLVCMVDGFECFLTCLHYKILLETLYMDSFVIQRTWTTLWPMHIRV